MKKMGYEGKGLGVNVQGIVNPIQVVELHHVGLGYFRVEGHSKPAETGESSRNNSDSVKDAERTSQHSSNSEHFKRRAKSSYLH